MTLPEIVVTFSAAFTATVMGGLALAAMRRADWFREKSIWLAVEYKRAPSDILRYIQPGTSVANMKEMLGAPVAETETNFKYRYRNLYVEAESDDGTTIDSITLVLPSVADGEVFEIHPINGVQYPGGDFLLGETRMGDVVEENDKLVANVSSKSGSVGVAKHYGNPGYHQTYVFGVFDGPSAPYDGPIPEGSVAHDDPSQKVINYLEITSDSELDVSGVAHFDFYTFRKLSA